MGPKNPGGAHGDPSFSFSCHHVGTQTRLCYDRVIYINDCYDIIFNYYTSEILTRTTPYRNISCIGNIALDESSENHCR